MRRHKRGGVPEGDVLPVYDDIRNVEAPKEGERIHVTGDGPQDPMGVWFFDGERWFSGDRSRIGAHQRTVAAGELFILQEFGLPADTEIAVWEIQVTAVVGADDGLVFDVRNETTGTTIVDYLGDNEQGIVRQGSPLGVGGSGGDFIQVRVRNTSGVQKDITGFAMLSIESKLQ